MTDINQYKTKLEEEKARIESALDEIGRRDPANQENWDSVPAESGETTFHDEVADRFEEMDERKATEFSLETELRAINDALEKIANDTFGRCEICGADIESDRLEANPSAKTCKKHLDQI